MVYGDESQQDVEKRTQRRRLMMEQIAFDGDLKKNQRAQGELTTQERKITQDIKRLHVEQESVMQQMKKLKAQETFLTGELHRIKNELINIQ